MDLDSHIKPLLKHLEQDGNCQASTKSETRLVLRRVHRFLTALSHFVFALAQSVQAIGLRWGNPSSKAPDPSSISL